MEGHDNIAKLKTRGITNSMQDFPSVEFPAAFPFQSIFSQSLDNLDDNTFLVCGMLTNDYSSRALTLVESCRNFNIPFVFYEVPTVHSSISASGINDLAFTKANFIAFIHNTYNRPVLYIDVDCIIEEYPEKIKSLVETGVDFAIYNWLADRHNPAYAPVDIELESGNPDEPKMITMYKFSFSIDYYSTSQLVSSGAVQFYNNTDETNKFLHHWHNIVAEFPNSADDKCMDYAYNNFISDKSKLKVAWLEKSYARYAYWIYVKPVINHPDFPCNTNDFMLIPENDGRKRTYTERMEYMDVNYCFPKDCLIEPGQKILLKAKNGQLIPAGAVTQALWI